MKLNGLIRGLVVLSFFPMAAQSLHHDMISAQGQSNILNNGMYVSQTIGQQSVIGNKQMGDQVIGQGFQQSMWHRYLALNAGSGVSVVTYPNPFVGDINFQFSKTMADPINISIFDIRGRLVYGEERTIYSNILAVKLEAVSDGQYLVKLTSKGFSYYTQILKKG